MKSKNAKLTETESKIVVCQGWSGEKWGDARQRDRNKMNEF